MRIIGDGFLAGHLRSLAARHQGVTVIAAGVSGTGATAPSDLDREAHLVYRTVDECRANGDTLVFLSTASMAMYGSPNVAADEESPVRPPSVYGRHKLALECVVRDCGVPWLVLRLSHAVGPGQREHQLVPTLVRQVRAAEVTVLAGAHRDLLDVRDLTVAVDGLLEIGARGLVVNVASGQSQPIEAVIDAIERRLGVRATRSVRQGGASCTPVDTSRLRHLVPSYDAGCTRGVPDPAGYLERTIANCVSAVM